MPLLSFSVVFVMFAVVFVALHNAAHRLTYGDVSISCYNVICLFPVWVHFAWKLCKGAVLYANPVSCVAVCSKHTPLPGPFLLLYSLGVDVGRNGFGPS